MRGGVEVDPGLAPSSPQELRRKDGLPFPKEETRVLALSGPDRTIIGTRGLFFYGAPVFGAISTRCSTAQRLDEETPISSKRDPPSPYWVLAEIWLTRGGRGTTGPNRPVP